MEIKVRVLADSLAPCGKRIVTVEATYPRCIHSEILTHKMLSRNSASSRAIPTEKLIQRIIDDPFVPSHIGSNQKGMQAGQELSDDKRQQAVAVWMNARDNAIWCARKMVELGVHKQVVNRAIEPFMAITIIMTTTELDNFIGLRDHTDAEPHFQDLARAYRLAVEASTPKRLKAGEWHTPLAPIDDEDRQLLSEYMTREFGHFHAPSVSDGMKMFNKNVTATMNKVSVGRCARVSYLTHDGRRDIKEDIALHDRLVVAKPLHASPAEHVAQALDWPAWVKFYPDLIKDGVDALQNRVLTFRREHEDERDLPPPAWLMHAETALAEMRSGNFYGWQQYRKTLAGENIGRLMP